MKLLKQQADAIQNINEQYNNGNKSIIYTSGVGTGKTTVLSGVADKFEGKILYVVPKNAIIANVLNNKFFNHYKLKNRTEFCTFNYFSTVKKGNVLENYSLVVIDEAHHIGSELYGNNLLKSITKHDTKVLGLTATPERMDDLNVETLFDSTVHGLTNFEAIMQGLQPQIEYLVCTPEDEVEVNVNEIDWWNSYNLLREAVEENPKDKWICFFSNIAQLEAMKPFVESLFPDYPVLEIHSDSDEDTLEVLNKANELEKCVMLNCNMLLEGLHFEKVNGILLFREVWSVPVFEQIIGRVQEMFKKEHPLVIDCSNTWKRMDRYVDFGNAVEVVDAGEEGTEEPHSWGTYGGSDGGGDYFPPEGDEPKSIDINGNGEDDSDEDEDIEIIDYTDIDKPRPKKPMYVSLKNKKYYDYMQLLKRKWEATLPQEVKYHNTVYPSIKEACIKLDIPRGTVVTRMSKDCELTFEKCVDDIINSRVVFRNKEYRDWSAVCKEYGIKRSTIDSYKRKNNSTLEEAVEYYINNPAKEPVKWTDKEIEIMNKFYTTEGTDVVKRLPHKTREQCKSFARRKGIKCIKVKKEWTDNELQILKQFYSEEGPDIERRLPNRTRRSCIAKAFELGLKMVTA